MSVKIGGKTLSKPEQKQGKYSRIFGLGEERVMVLNNMLAQGTSTIKVARTIQQEWNEFTDVAEKTLVQQINRYRHDHVPAISDSAVALTTNKPKLYEKLDIIEEMCGLVALQKKRIEGFIAKEGTIQMPIKGVNEEIKTLHEMLKDVQKAQFDLGLDVYQGPILQNGKITSTTVTATPDGVTVKHQTLDAVQAASRILDKHGVPREAVDIEGEFSDVGGNERR